MIPDSKRVENNVINVYPNKEYQIIEGFGAGLTEAAGYALSKMSKKKQEEAVQAYFGKNGIGYTLGRVPIDSCDAALGIQGIILIRSPW